MGPLADYLIESGIWAVVGFVGGFVFGRALATRDRIGDAGMTTPDASGPAHARRRWRPTGQQITGIVVVLLAVATIAQGLVESAATRRVVACQQEYGNRFADALDARTAANTTTQAALDRLVMTVGHVLSEKPSAQAGIELSHAVSSYLANRAELEKEQQQHPYPPAPRDLCPP